MTIGFTDSRETQTARRLRQFGLREVVVFTTCLAVTLALYRHAYHGVERALVLTLALGTLGWQAKRIQHAADVPLQFYVAVLAGFTLLLEFAAAWVYGYSGSDRSFWPAYFILAALRGLVAISASGDVLLELVRMALRKPLNWEEQTSRMGLTGRMAIVVLWLPLWFAAPLQDLGTLQLARSLGAQRIASAALQYTGHRESPDLVRLGMQDGFREIRSLDARGHYLTMRGDVSYWLRRTGGATWDVSVQTPNMPTTRIGEATITSDDQFERWMRQ